MEAFVEVENLEKTYSGGLFGSPVQALKGISFSIRQGELMGLLGPNGAGKTTTVKILSGLVTPTSGRARLLGAETGVPGARAQMGYLPERASWPEHLTGIECLEREGRLFGIGRSERKKRIERDVARVKLEVAKRKVGTYSKGERARLGLALALLPDPRVLLLDEPTDGLDPLGRREVRDLLVELKKEGRAILLNSHLLSEAELCCDHVAILARGSVVAKGGTEELLSKGVKELVLKTIPAPSDEDIAAIARVAKTVTRAPNDVTIVQLENENDVDKVVDAVRARGLSLRELTPKKPTLEQYFLQAVAMGGGGPGV
ncbi:MAG: ABC transporter ATP-binding protein [Planctomycetota bacterium]